jgi:SPP1 family predicted phage head-tail adaptor
VTAIGMLDRRVVIEAPPTAQDAAGQPSGSWTTVATVWANIRYLSGVEAIKAGATTSQAKASIRIRRRTDVTAAMRVTLGSTVFQVLAVLQDEAGKRWTDLACEVVA